MKIEKMLKRYRVDHGKHFRLKDHDPADTHGLDSEVKDEAKELLANGVEELSRVAGYFGGAGSVGAAGNFSGDGCGGEGWDDQARDVGGEPAGRGGNVVQGADRGGVESRIFVENLANMRRRAGRIGIFNRSYYEEVLVVRVHPEVLANEKLPKELVTKNIWEERYEDMRNFERYLTRNGIAVVKFFLHLSKKEQKRRFMERLETPEKNWKFSAADVKERGFWDAYQEAYEEAIRATATEYAPWHVVPADHKWFTRLVVSQALVKELKAMKLEYPIVSGAEKKALGEARRKLERE